MMTHEPFPCGGESLNSAPTVISLALPQLDFDKTQTPKMLGRCVKPKKNQNAITCKQTTLLTTV